MILKKSGVAECISAEEHAAVYLCGRELHLLWTGISWWWRWCKAKGQRSAVLVKGVKNEEHHEKSLDHS